MIGKGLVATIKLYMRRQTLKLSESVQVLSPPYGTAFNFVANMNVREPKPCYIHSHEYKPAIRC
jgi:hypothetical protein